jgi:hypothetical protein
MGGGRIFLEAFLASLFNDDLSNEHNFGRIHLAGQYQTHFTSGIYFPGLACIRIYLCLPILLSARKNCQILFSTVLLGVTSLFLLAE